jgi:hypothetical protein
LRPPIVDESPVGWVTTKRGEMSWACRVLARVVSILVAIGAAAAARADEPSCDADGWCWHQPLGRGGRMAAGWSSAADGLRIVGPGGLLLHRIDGSWESEATPLDRDEDRWDIYFRSLWTTHGDVWMAGSRAVNRPLGARGVVFRRSGAKWTQWVVPDARSVWGSAANDVWVAGHGYLGHFDGVALSKVALGTDAVLWNALWGTSARDVWLVGSDYLGNTFAEHFDGEHWFRVHELDMIGQARGIAGRSMTDVWAIGADVLAHLSGTEWAAVKVEGLGQATFDVIAVDRNGEVWLALSDGRILSYADGKVRERRGPEELQHMFAALVPSWEGMLALGWGRLLSWSGDAWHDLNGSDENLKAVWSSGANDVWVVAAHTISHFDGRSWSRVPAKYELNAIWGSAPDDIWAVGQGALHFDGEKWSEVSNDQMARAGALTAIWGTSARDIWIGAADGKQGSVLHFDGNRWTSRPMPVPIQALSGAAPNVVWAVGWNAKAMKTAWLTWNGKKWIERSHPGRMDSICGFSDRDVFAGGSDAWHWNGHAWATIHSQLKTLHCTAPDDIWASGGPLFGAVFHFDGKRWTQARVAPTGVTAFAGGGASPLWAVGLHGIILSRPRP